jgi:predicted lipoprotein with Yx(FWY)xxD motif
MIGGLVILAGCAVDSGGGGSPSPDASTSAATPTATAVSPPPSVVYKIDVAQSAALGAYLTGAGGKTLYTYQLDTATTSQCNDTCADSWPPFAVEADAKITAGTGASGGLLTIERADGTQQVTYAGHPLYYYGGDAAAGDTNGEGMANGDWHVATP